MCSYVELYIFVSNNYHKVVVFLYRDEHGPAASYLGFDKSWFHKINLRLDSTNEQIS